MTHEEIRTLLYPFGFLSTFFFGLRFLIQWFQSEKKKESIVPEVFWHISLLGNTCLFLHSFIQLQFPVFLLQSQNIVFSWRNLNLNKERPVPFSFMPYILTGAAVLSTLLFFLQSFFFPISWIPRGSLSSSMHLLGILGIGAYSLRFWLQWYEREQTTKVTNFSLGFWYISILGASLAGWYFFLLRDWVNFIGPFGSILPYARNIFLLKRKRAPPCDVVLLAGEASGDSIGAKIAKGLLKQNPSTVIHGVAGPKMREEGVHPWLFAESFQVMGFFDVIKKAPFLFFALRKIEKSILQASPKTVVVIDQPSLGAHLAKRLRKKGFSGTLIQAVAPTVWAYKPHRVEALSKHFDLVLPLFRFETPFFEGKMKTVWAGHPIIEDHDFSKPFEKEPIIALFPGSRKGEIKRNLPLQIRASHLIEKQFPHVKFAIVFSSYEMEPWIRKESHSLGAELVPFQDRFELMKKACAAFAKSGTVTLELALFNTPFVTCYETGALTRFLLKHFFKLKPRHFALPNILMNKQIVPECIIPPVHEKDLAHEISPYILGTKTLPDNLSLELFKELDAGRAPSDIMAEAIIHTQKGSVP